MERGSLPRRRDQQPRRTQHVNSIPFFASFQLNLPTPEAPTNASSSALADVRWS